MDIKKMKDLIEQKKLRGMNRKPKYATRKLTIGLVSCMLGFSLLVSPAAVEASEPAESVEITDVEQGGAADSSLSENPTEEEKETVTPEEKSEDGANIEEDSIKETEKKETEGNNLQNNNNGLEIGDEIVKGPVKAENEDKNNYLFDVNWNDTRPGKDIKYYNPKLKGNPIEAYLYLEFTANDPDNPGKKKFYYTEYKKVDFNIGQSKQLDLRDFDVLDENKKKIDITKFEGIGDKMLRWPVAPWSGNAMWSLSGDSRDNPIANTDVDQNMNTRVEYEENLDKNSLILDEDKDKLDLKYNIKDKDGNIVRNKKRGNVEIKENDKFTIEERREHEKWLSLKRKDYDDDSIRQAITNSLLKLYSPAKGEKYRTYNLEVQFDGDEKERLDKYYNLDISGDDLLGWKVTLSSNLRKGQKSEEEKTPFKVVYKLDPTLEEGQEKVIDEGQEGIVEKITKYVYLIDENGNEVEVIEGTSEVETKTLQELRNKVIAMGMKKPKPSEPSDPSGNPDDSKPSNPSEDNKPSVPSTDTTEDSGDEDIYDHIKDLIDEINKEEKENKEETEKPSDNKDTESKEETTNPTKDTKDEKTAGNKDDMKAPMRDSKGNKLAGKNVKTGLGSASGLFGLIGAATAGLFATKKKEDEEDK